MILTEERTVAVPQLALRSLLETIVGSITRNTPEPQIEHIPYEAHFTLKVDPLDQGRMVGKLGGTIWAIKTIFWFAGYTQMGFPYDVKLFDYPAPPRKAPPVKFTKKWPREKIENLISEINDVCLRSAFGSFILEETGTTTLTVKLKLEKYLELSLSNPNFIEAVSTVLRVAGYSNGVQIKTEATFA